MVATNIGHGSRPHETQQGSLFGKIRGTLLPGVFLASMIAAASLFTEAQMGGPVMLYALVLGALFNPIAAKPSLAPGLSFSANCILKIGVALLAVKITVFDVAALGWQTAALVTAGVTFTLIVGTSIGRLFGMKTDHAILSSGAVAICGSSAALAIAAVLPQNKNTQCNTIVTVIMVTALSTLAMVVYPLISNVLGFSETQAGIFMGVTIHNVAQVVGAGYMVSDGAGEVATIVKLMRVACLFPVIVIISLMFRRKACQGGMTTASTPKRPPLLPVFMAVFIVIMLINSLGFIPSSLTESINVVSRWALVIAVAALGVKTSVKEVLGVGLTPIIVLVLQTAFLAVLACGALTFLMSA